MIQIACILFSLITLSCSTIFAKENPPEPLPVLSKVIEQGLLGLQAEPKEAQTLLLEQAKRFVQHYAGRSEQKTLTEYLQYCKANPETDPFCGIFHEFQSLQKAQQQKRKSLHRTAQLSATQIQKLITNAQLEKLTSLSETELQEGFKRISSLDQIKAISNQVIQDSTCSTGSLSALLAAKTEEFLPDAEAKQSAIQMYEKATRCSSSESQQVKARFRLSLLQVWSENCTAAIPHLQYLTEHIDGLNDYRSRALYWESYCQNLLKKPEDSEKSKKALLQKYPFSFHTLLIQGEDLEHKLSQTMQPDSPIEVRSENAPELNQKIRAIEALLRLEQKALAKKILTSLEGKILKSKPTFQLYIAALYHTLDDSLTKFKLLTIAFRENPSLISKASLKLYYPHKNWTSKDLHTAEVDEMLLLALIRQESAFNPHARSSAGALGLMQIMPHTARRFERIRTLKELLNPTTNLKIGTRYFSSLLRNYNGDAGLALAAYNAGPKRVEDWLKRYPVKDKALFLDLIPFKETREYVASIARNYYWYTSLYSEDRPNPAISQRTLNKVFTLSGS